MIGVLIVDDHPAVRAGVVALLRREPSIVPMAAAQGAQEAMNHAERARPAVALLDYALGDGDGIALCYLKRLAASPSWHS